MTLKELADRLNEIVEFNKERGWPERNDLPAMIEVTRKGKRRKNSHYFTEIHYVSSCQFGLKGEQYCGVLTVSEDSIVK
jgi:hypothetical protein